MLEEQEAAVVDPRQTRPVPPGETERLVFVLDRVGDLLPLHPERRIGEQVVEPLVRVLIALVATSSLAALGQALVKLKVPTKLCLLLLFSYRYIFVIHQEYLRLVRAARLRCFKATTSLHTYRTTGYLFGMTLIKSHHRAQRVKQAMALRGFQGQFHTLYESQVGKNEITFALCMSIAVAILISIELFNRIPL